MRSAVGRAYPETEEEKPIEKRQGAMPPSIATMVKEAELETSASSIAELQASLFSEKNAVPGDAPQ
eukprot:11504277-Karenia_brevis.AAC.1